ncbi:Putative Flp pilus-assembly TadE/G-like [Sanguibacter gelidistatuariae]|uniref:Putative Flp pilus-assembly TadE/G-like n=1 Tax=Sanguibacter gelidistatuariae TaxID=1814289 RepID=A0A1G6MS32_9MICO|nr:pilus assembly protein TadG-related protein [Sanguibacter gelidistatuariae]SDC58398.1 Putative Flp pilus-assembly TadE/G-like [Sanguibacter gelidistatuariae]
MSTGPVGAHRRWASRLPARGDESGQILVLALGLTLVVLLLVTVIVSLTGIHLERKRLIDLADNLALAAADAMTEESIYGAIGAPGAPNAGTAGPASTDANLPLTDDDVVRAVADYLVAHPDAMNGLSDVVVLEASSPDGRSARVVLTSLAQPALISPVTSLFSDGVTLRAQSTARVW